MKVYFLIYIYNDSFVLFRIITRVVRGIIELSKKAIRQDRQWKNQYRLTTILFNKH